MLCNYQGKASRAEIDSALSEYACCHCGVTSADLSRQGATLEICGEEHGSSLDATDRMIFPIALCPSCHEDNHRDAQGNHVPCQISARLSREGLG